MENLGTNAIEKLAFKYMQEILYASGHINALDPENKEMYPRTDLEKISWSLSKFTDQEFEILNNSETIDQIVNGEETENVVQFGGYSNWVEFYKSLNNFFNCNFQW